MAKTKNKSAKVKKKAVKKADWRFEVLAVCRKMLDSLEDWNAEISHDDQRQKNYLAIASAKAAISKAERAMA